MPDEDDHWTSRASLHKPSLDRVLIRTQGQRVFSATLPCPYGFAEPVLKLIEKGCMSVPGLGQCDLVSKALLRSAVKWLEAIEATGRARAWTLPPDVDGSG